MIKDFELSTKFPFGFFRHRRRLPAREAEMIVFPAIDPTSPEIDNMPIDLGSLTSAKRGIGRDLQSLREYQPQDDLRHIDWKATARTQHLTVREFAAEDEKRMTVILDSQTQLDPTNRASLRERLAAEQSGKGPAASTSFEQRATLAASILLNFTMENGESRLVVDGDAGEYGSGRPHLYDSLKRLALADPSFSADPISTELAANLERVLIESDDSLCVLITANGGLGLSPEILQRLKIIGV